MNRFSVCARLAACVGLLVFGIGSAFAFPVTWTLSGVTFSDGGTASGSFVYDADTNTLSNWSVSVAGGNTATFPPMTYDTTTASGTISGQGATNTGVNLTAAGNRQLRMPSVSPLADAGGTIAIDLSNLYQGECYNCSPYRSFTAGNLIGTPDTAAPVITSAASASFAPGATVSFTVTATGVPVPALSITGTLPGGVTFTDNGDGTGTFAGTPTAGVTGGFPLTITASNGVAPDATQAFVLALPAPVAPTPTLDGFGMLACILLLLALAWRVLARRESALGE